MSLPIVKVNMTLRTATVSRAGFGVLLFLSGHKAFSERVRSYRDLDSVAEDFTESSDAYKAAKMYFSHTPSPDMIKLGRIAGASLLSPSSVEAGSDYSITIQAGEQEFGFNYTALQEDGEVDVVAYFLGAIQSEDGLSDYLTVSTENDGETLKIEEQSYGFTYKTSENFELGYVSTETYTEALVECVAEDGDFYAIASTARSNVDVKALASLVETMSRVYFVALSDIGALSTLGDESTDTFAELAELGYTRTAGMYSQIANDDFPECSFWGANATYSPDEQGVVWSLLQLAGIPLARDGSGKVLSATQQTALDARNVSYMFSSSVGTRLYGGKMVSGEWIDNIQTSDCIEARVKESLEEMFLNQAGGKVVGGRTGLLQCKSAISAPLEPFVSAQSIDNYFVNIEDATIDFATRTVSNLKFSATLTGAILHAVVNGTLEN